MIYKTFKDKELSALGMGCMRLPQNSKTGSDIDMNTAKEIIAYAMENGINYFDTAWAYHDGQSEIAIGELLKEYPRESFNLTTKFPGFDVATMEKVDEIFNKQLEKCQVEYFDFYLLHCICESNLELYKDDKYGVIDYLLKQKKEGRIGHLGFSFHGSLDTLKSFLSEHGHVMEFCQLQLNWFDWSYQNAKEEVEIATSYNLPVWVMEPVRGGSLVNLQPKYKKKLKALHPDWTMPQWAFRFVQSVLQVKMILSGMSNMAQIKENIKTFENNEPLSEEDLNALFDIAKDMASRNTLPCTKCRYCTSHCPKGLDIPWMIEQYNEHDYTRCGLKAPDSIKALEDAKSPKACIGCKACEVSCPQNIKISEMMSEFTEMLKNA